MSRAWCLNLDAELELADPSGYRPSPRMRTLVAQQSVALLGRIRRAIGHEDDVVVVPGEPLPDAVRIGEAWCPTPRAITELRAAGARLDPRPSLEILQRVNHRAFAVRLCEPLPGARFVTSMAALDAVLAGDSCGRGWLLKRPFGFSGRWRKRVDAGALEGDARTWAMASMRSYGRGLQVEPFVRIVREFALHGCIEPSGALRIGKPTVLWTDPDGGWIENRPVRGGELELNEERMMHAAAERAAGALVAAGYAGPFGIDAFRWRDSAGRRRWHALSDLNARYTMGYWDGMA